MFANRMRELMDPRSGWCVVTYTKQAVKTTVYILMDVNVNLRFWTVSPHLAREMDELDLDTDSVALRILLSFVDYLMLLSRLFMPPCRISGRAVVTITRGLAPTRTVAGGVVKDQGRFHLI